VEFTWADTSEEVHPDELLLASSEQEEEEQLEQLESELQSNLEVLLAKADEVSRKRIDKLLYGP
jgi:hypothetical protein